MKKQHRLPFITTIFTGALILAGCTAEANLKALDRTPSAEDQLPNGAQIWPENVVSTDGARLLTTHNGIKYFAAKSSDSKTACIAAIPENQTPESWVVGCGSTGGPGYIVQVSGSNGAGAMLVADGDAASHVQSGWTQVHENVLITGQ